MADGNGMELAKAYVQIIPTTKGIKEELNRALSDEDIGTSAGENIGSRLLKSLSSVVTVAAVGKVMSKAFLEGADLEQSLGGVETMFKENADKVIDYANDAYKTAGVSANQYMQNVTSFSAALLSSLGGDTAKAAETANMAMIDMSDNSNKFGSDIAGIQDAYQGFAKQNYTMLDNLKLGYGGTRSEMERLLQDAEKLSGVKYDISSLSDVYTAVHVIQTELGVAGTTSKEAASTFSGSFGSMKSAADNFLGTLTNGGDIDKAFGDLTSSSKTFADNFKRMADTMFRQIKDISYSVGDEFGMTKKQVDFVTTAVKDLTVATVVLKTTLSLQDTIKKSSLGLGEMNIQETLLLAKSKLVSGEFLKQHAGALKVAGAIGGAVVAGELLASAIDNATDKIDEVGNKYEGLTQNQRDFIDAIDDTSIAISNHINDRKTDLGDIEDMAEGYRNTADALYELNQKEQLSAEDKQTMAIMANTLGGEIEGLNIKIDEETGHLLTQKDAVDDLIESMEKQRKLELMGEDIPEMLTDHKKAVEAQAKALDEYNKAKADRTATEKQLQDLKRFNELNRNSTQLVGKEREEFNNLTHSLKNVFEEYGSCDNAMSGLNKKLDDQKNAVGATATAYTQSTETLRGLEDQMTSLGVSGVDYVTKTTNFADASKAAFGEMATATKTAFQDVKDSFKGVVDVSYSVGDNIYTVSRETADGIKEIQAAYRETVQQTTDDLYDSLNLFEEFPYKADISAQTLIENMNSNLIGIQQWGENMEYLVDHGVSEGLISYLRDMGYDSASYVQAMRSMTDPELQKYSDDFDSAYGTVEKSAEQSLGNAKKVCAEQIKGLIDQTSGQKIELENAYDILGGYCGTGFVAGIERSTPEVEAAMEVMADKAYRRAKKALRIESPSKLFRGLARYVPQGAALGVEDDTPLVEQAAQDMADRAAEAAAFGHSDIDFGINYGENYKAVQSVVRSNAYTDKTALQSTSIAEIPEKSVTQFIVDGRVFAEVMMPFVDVIQGTKVQLAKRGVAGA